jgi:hypothetical protein
MSYDFTCLVCVDALAADEPASNAFTEAFNLLAPDGWVAFHLNAETAEGGRDSRFARVVHRMIQSGAMNVATQQRYRHRFSPRPPIFHVGVVARKVGLRALGARRAARATASARFAFGVLSARGFGSRASGLQSSPLKPWRS